MLEILIIEDEQINRVTLAKLLKHEGYAVQTAKNGTEGLEMIQKQPLDVILTDLRLPGADGMEILRYCKEHSPDTPVLIMTAYATVKNAVECLKLGAFNYLTKPFDPSELYHQLEQIAELKKLGDQNEELRTELAELKINPDMVGNSEAMRSLLEKVKVVSGSAHAVLIQGASGTGKELIANTIQSLSSRSDKPFIKVNCSALSETLFESEMFGHEKGAFTGAVGRVIGRFERATGGTIFLDDIDDLSMGLQTKLLRVLQEGEIERVGGNKVIKIDVRIIAATKVDLKEKVDDGGFREDFYYRLNVVKLRVPPLSERRVDIPLLVEYFLKKEFKGKRVSQELAEFLCHQSWPGNIRELQHVIQQMAIFTETDTLGVEHLPEMYREKEKQGTDETGRLISEDQALADRVTNFEREIILKALRENDYNQKKVAEILMIPRTTLRSKIEKLQLDDDE